MTQTSFNQPTPERSRETRSYAHILRGAGFIIAVTIISSLFTHTASATCGYYVIYGNSTHNQAAMNGNETASLADISMMQITLLPKLGKQCTGPNCRSLPTDERSPSAPPVPTSNLKLDSRALPTGSITLDHAPPISMLIAACDNPGASRTVPPPDKPPCL